MRQQEAEFADYVAARWPSLVRFVILLGCAPADAEDVVQTALEKCLANLSKVTRANDRDAYVHRVVINTFISSRRRRWVSEVPTSTESDALARPHIDQDLDRVNDTDTVMRALNRLDRDQRVAVLLRYYMHLDEQSMSEVLRVPPGTVKSRLHRALAKLSSDLTMREMRDQC